VNIVYFDLGHGEDYIYHGTTDFRGIHKHDLLKLSEKEKEHYPGSVHKIAHVFPEYYVLKVSGFDLKIKDTLDEWVYALKESEVKPEFTAKGIHEASRTLARLSLSEEERQAYERHIGDARISKSTLDSSYSDGKREGLAEGKAEGLAEGKAEGLAEGEAKGKAEGKAEMIRNLHALGLSIEQLAQASQLSVEEVSNVLKKV
jgi:hypothetical protein